MEATLVNHARLSLVARRPLPAQRLRIPVVLLAQADPIARRVVWVWLTHARRAPPSLVARLRFNVPARVTLNARHASLAVSWWIILLRKLIVAPHAPRLVSAFPVSLAEQPPPVAAVNATRDSIFHLAQRQPQTCVIRARPFSTAPQR